MIAEGYADARTLARRIKKMEDWLADPQLLEPDADAEYAAVIEIDLADIHEPIVACPNDPDDVKTLSEVAGAQIDEVFIGSCMTNIGHSVPRPSCWKASAISRPACGSRRRPRWTPPS